MFQKSTFVEIFKYYFPISLVSFGGPQAHIAMFHDKFVDKLNWLSDATFTELFAVTQALPGPASTQLAFAIALLRGGPLAAIFSHLIWSLPGTLMMIAFAYGIDYIGNSLPRFLIFIVNGLTSAAVGLVALAAYKLGSKILKDKIGIFISTFSCVVSINYSSSWILPALMAFGGIATIVFGLIKKEEVSTTQNPEILDAVQGEEEVSTKGDHYYSKKVGYILFGIWLGMLILALVCKGIVIPRTIDVVATMYYVGSIIFGGGPVVIPLMQNYVVQGNWLSNQEFLIGLAIINSMPGPNFNLSAFCGALALRNSPVMFLGAFLGTIGVFTPGLLLMAAFIPFWRSFRELKIVQTLFQGVNAAAVGLVFSAIYVLSLKSIVLQSGGLSNEVGKLVDYPLYTAISIVTFSSAGFLNLSAPIAILIGGCIGLLDWILQGTQ